MGSWYGLIPLLDLPDVLSPGFALQARKAMQRPGCFALRHPLFPKDRCEQVLSDARAFFALPSELKRSLGIERSEHFRGYSEMHNERDFREQIHFGREEAFNSRDPAYEQLRGRNLWPPDPAWQGRILRLMDDLEQAGRDVLAALASASFLAPDEKSYLLLKLIHYPAPPSRPPRAGVAPHVDFSWITLLIQDDAGGLDIRTPDGEWLPVPSIPGTLIVNAGEILEFATGGYYKATPHRVVNRSQTRSRVSLPFFLNPALDTRIEPGESAGNTTRHDDHVHRVLRPSDQEPFVFGEAEWMRKGLGVWCAACVPPAKSTSASTSRWGPNTAAPR